VVTLKEQGGGGVYRLEGATPGGRTVVAKRDHPDRLAPERFLYEATLPGLAVPHPGYLGSFEESEEMAWLFIEDVGDARFDPAQASHRSAASRWLAALHLAGEAAAVLDLPDRGPAHYREHLRSLRSRATDHQEDPRLGAAGRRLLRRLLFHCDILEENWDRIEAACVGLPRTVVHGDFAPKNVAVRHRGGSVEVLPFDWELGGWGVPAPDLTLVDLDVYGRCVSRTWPSWTGRRAKETRALGVLFRAVAECDWAATFLPYDPVERSLPRLIVSETRLAEAAGDLFSLAS
jgi:hypothetical protein